MPKRLAVCLALSLAAMPADAHPERATLVARAVQPADTFAGGPESGRYIGPGPFGGLRPPFPGQTVQGYSGLVPLPDGRFLANTDNGFGTMENSADHLLRIYTLKPSFRTAQGGDGKLRTDGYVTLADPDRHVPWTLVNELTPDRQLTGADFDPESLARAEDGTLWLGDEFGPFLLHVDATGRLLEAPIPFPGVASPQNPAFEEATPVRLMDALRAEARRHGGTRPLICSPDNLMIADGDPATALDSRRAPDPASGLPPASSEIFDVKSLTDAGFGVVPWTVNDPARMRRLIELGVTGLISDDPELLRQVLASYPDRHFLLPDGRVDPARFDLEGHRGARNRRPENTLPAFEAGLDALANTLETDCQLTRDGHLVLSHDGFLGAPKVEDGHGHLVSPPKPIRELTLARARAFVADGLLPDRPLQRRELALSPVAVAFARKHHRHPYAVPTLDELFDFVAFYGDYYAARPGAAAMARARNARSVRFDLETKVRPINSGGEVAGDAARMARLLAGRVHAHGLDSRSMLESFDFRSLLTTAREYPGIQLVALLDDGPIWKDPAAPGSEDGTNVQGPGDGRSPWLAGLKWPYRHTFLGHPPRVQQSGGLESLAFSPDGRWLYAALEKPLKDDGHHVWFRAYDTRCGCWRRERWAYPLAERARSLCDVAMVGPRDGVAIERDGTQGDMAGFKRIFRFHLGRRHVEKCQVADLMDLADPAELGHQDALPGDIGIGDHRFAFPYETPEGLAVLDATHVAVCNDNNFPFGLGRHEGARKPDDDELIEIELARPLYGAR